MYKWPLLMTNGKCFKNKVINNTLGKFGNKKRDFNEEIDSHEMGKIMPKVIRKYPTIKKCLTCLEILLYKNKFYRISKFGYISKRVKSNIYYMGSDSSSICLGKRDFTIYFDLVECV